MAFIEAFKWVTSFVREPSDFALIAADLAEQLLAQNVVYAEVTLSVGVMLLRQQNPQANFEAILAAVEPFEQTGSATELDFRRGAAIWRGSWPCKWSTGRSGAIRSRIVAFGIGGDELSVPTQGLSRGL